MADFYPPVIANVFVDLNGGPLPQMKMHKLSYIAHGWNLIINDESLIREQPEAWDNGPVYRRIWNRIRDYGTDNRGHVLLPSGRPYEAELSPDETGVIEHVWRKYRKYDANRLSMMTHQPGTPWTLTYFGRGRNQEIDNELIATHYRDLALAGRNANTG